MKIGIIGTGNMGTILTKSLIEGMAAPPSDFIIMNRTITKANSLKESYPDITVVESPNSVVRDTEIVFICIKPTDIHSLLATIKDDLSEGQLLVSITSPITVEQIESAVDCKVARMVPTIANQALAGATLLTFGSRCGTPDRGRLLSIADKISRPVTIEEPIVRVASDLSSCGPAFMSYLLERMVTAAVSETHISTEQATDLVGDMAIGLGKLLEKKIFTLKTLKEKVHVKGGVTGVGLNVLEEELDGVFERLFRETQLKFKEDHELVDQQFETLP